MLRSALRWPAHVVNGISVAFGIALVQLVVSSLASPRFAQAASIGAVLASLPHLSGRAGPIVRRVLVGGLLASFATFLVLAAEPYPALRGLLVAQIAFLALLGMAYGPRAGSMVFSIVIGLVFSLAHPSGGESLFVAGACASGVGLYAVWAFWSTRWLEARYRVLAVAAALDAAGSLLRVRARVLLATHVEETEDQDRARFDQLNDEVQLAQALQSARDLVHPAVHAPRAAMQAAVLARLGELREIVLTSRLDLELLGHDAAARYTRARLAVGLRHLGQGLAELGAAHREGREATLPTHEWGTELPDFHEAAQLLEDERARLLPVVVARLRYLTEEVDALGTLLRGTSDRLSLSPEELRRTVADDETWPLAALLEHLTVRSPVLRHAVRSALALTTAYFVAYALPWSTKPYWLLLSVAVVLRGTLDDTLSRRNARVLGTAIGCVLVAVTVPLVAEPVLKASFVIAVGAAHAFVNVRYLLTAIAATVMALLQAHFASPELGFLVAERLLDTVIGALFAWAFSYVLPSWERRTLPIAIERVLESLRHYGECALSLEGAREEQRLARQRAYDAIAVVGAALRRSVAEPKRVRPPQSELVSALDHAQRLMAHLSSVRSLLTRRAASLPTDDAKPLLERARRQLVEQLQREAPAESSLRARSIPELPLAPAERDALPWLERRLEASLHDACLAGSAARAALGALDRTRVLESP